MGAPTSADDCVKAAGKFLFILSVLTNLLPVLIDVMLRSRFVL